MTEIPEPQILARLPGLLLLNKAAGMPVERNRAGHFSVEDWVLQWAEAHERAAFAGIAHRLDRPVSGLLAVATRPAMLKALNAAFAAGQMRKTYLAMVSPAPPARAADLQHWHYKDSAQQRALISETPLRGYQPARLHYRQLAALPGGALLQVRLFSGRYHQIRAQLAAIGCPILGDARYGSAEAFEPEAIALHAWRLSLPTLPGMEAQSYDAPLPELAAWTAAKDLVAH